jgi:hypothetical protein
MDHLFIKHHRHAYNTLPVTMKLMSATFACFRIQNVSLERPAYPKAASKKFDKKAADL